MFLVFVARHLTLGALLDYYACPVNFSVERVLFLSPQSKRLSGILIANERVAFDGETPKA